MFNVCDTFDLQGYILKENVGDDNFVFPFFAFFLSFPSFISFSFLPP